MPWITTGASVASRVCRCCRSRRTKRLKWSSCWRTSGTRLLPGQMCFGGGGVYSMAFMRYVVLIFALCLALTGLLQAKDALPPVGWPDNSPLLQFTVSKMNHVGGYQGQQSYSMELAVTNVSGKRISQASFVFYLFDKQKVRVGQGYIDLANVSPNETVKMQVNAVAMGTPASFTITPQHLPAELAGAAPPKTIPVTVYSVPSGAR